MTSHPTLLIHGFLLEALRPGLEMSDLPETEPLIIIVQTFPRDSSHIRFSS